MELRTALIGTGRAFGGALLFGHSGGTVVRSGSVVSEAGEASG